MENPTTLLVAIMFVTILAMSIGNILVACAEIAGGLRRPTPEAIQLSWIFLMLLALLSLFWETSLLLDINEWMFGEFLYVIAGPMILLFASSVITAPAQNEDSGKNTRHYFTLHKRFFIMLALHEAWVLGLDYFYKSFNLMSLINALMFIVFLLLAFSGKLRVHIVGAALVWAGYILGVFIRTT